MATQSVNCGSTLWEGRPREVRAAPFFTVTSLLAFGLGIILFAFAVVRHLALGDHSPTSLLSALSCVTLGALIHELPAFWHGRAVYRVTRDHVLCFHGPFRRAI